MRAHESARMRSADPPLVAATKSVSHVPARFSADRAESTGVSA